MTNPRIGGNGDFKGSTRRMLVVAKGASLPEWFLIVIASLFRGSVSGNNWKKREVERKRRGRGGGETKKSKCPTNAKCWR